MNVACAGNDIVVRGDGREWKIAPTMIPVSLWNEAVVEQSSALDPQNGSVVAVKVADRGEDDLVVQGRATRARHYVITTTFTQDVWYDNGHRLVKVELKGSDGSTIRYQLV